MRNPVLPFALIAFLGIFAIVIISYVGVYQREAIQNPENGDVTESLEPQEIYNTNNCLGCHGSDLTGGSGSDLTQVGSRLSEEEIKEIIMEGKGIMPGGLVNDEQANILAEWLSGMQ